MSQPSLQKLAILQTRMQELGIEESDLEEEFIRGSGSGGQKINKTSVCVRLKHLPSGIEVRCQETRSQSMNRFLARRALCEKLAAQVLKVKTALQNEREKIRRQKRRRSRRAKEKILQDKKVASQKKKLRCKPDANRDS